jgi:hypothetical protein
MKVTFVNSDQSSLGFRADHHAEYNYYYLNGKNYCNLIGQD